jgi:hypothetical protein
MTSRVDRSWRSRLTVVVGLGLTVAAAACGGDTSSATSPAAPSVEPCHKCDEW